MSVHAFAEFSTVEQCCRMEFKSCRLPQLCSEETRPNFGFGSSEKDRCACALHFHMVAELRAPDLWVQHTSKPWHSQGNHPCLFLSPMKRHSKVCFWSTRISSRSPSSSTSTWTCYVDHGHWFSEHDDRNASSASSVDGPESAVGFHDVAENGLRRRAQKPCRRSCSRCGRSEESSHSSCLFRIFGSVQLLCRCCDFSRRPCDVFGF